MTLLFIRHASVVKESKRDSLTDLGKTYVENLPNLIKEKGYNKIDYIYYVNTVKSNQPEIERCYKTIENISSDIIKKIRWNEFPLDDPSLYLEKTIIICYIKQSLKSFPIKPYNSKKFYTDKSRTDKLYEEILIFNYKSGEFRLIDKIKTNDKSVDK